MGGLPLPRSKLVGVADGFEPAPLDSISLWNGAMKFDHPQECVEADFADYAFSVLDHFFPMMRLYSSSVSREFAESRVKSPDHANKASGYPWTFMGAPTKASMLVRHPNYSEFDHSILNSTLKDEIRACGKDSRFFRPQSGHDYVEGTILFFLQNEYLLDLLFVSPIFAKYTTPGRDLSLLYQILEDFGGNLYDADGSQWDAHYPLCVAEIACAWRARFHTHPEAVFEYYRRMYNGVTLVGGHYVPLVGQPSGHVNTTSDNCLGNIIAMAYHAYRCGMDVDDFTEQVKFFCCGDDLIWSDNSGLFNPAELNDSYNRLGLYLEFGSLDPRPLSACNFVGTTPIKVDGIWRYYGRVEKLAASAVINRRRASLTDKLSKLCAIAVLLRYSEYYEVYAKLAWDFVVDAERRNLLSSRDPRVAGCLRFVTSPQAATRLYDEFESCSFF